jgi:VCBS repeat-containing protein
VHVNPVTGAVTYTPTANFVGADAFRYRISDNDGVRSNDALASLVVQAVNHAPVAVNDSFAVNEDATLVVPASGVLVNDTDQDGDTLLAHLVNGPAHGNLTLNPDGSFTYTPLANFNGVDSFSYSANDGTADSNTAAVTLTVNAVNDAPLAVNDPAFVNANTTVAINVLANDVDPDGSLNPATLAITSMSTHGIVSINPISHLIAYTPQPGFSGTDSFRYRVRDNQGLASNQASVAITVTTEGNHAPAAVSDTYSTTEDTALVILAGQGVLANDTDVDGNPLTATLGACRRRKLLSVYYWCTPQTMRAL